ncbi:serine hydrolase, partial [Pelagibacteraceae bacterium]|nr:serine hydrolase [Pelagibacteraceae bacterium]
MKKNLLLVIILNSFLILSFSSNLFAKKAAIVIDFETEEVLFEVNADTRNYPASLTKIMTLYIVFDYIKKGKLSFDSQLNVSSVAASRSPSKLYLEEGSSIKVKDAVNALIIKSANDVATVVAENIAGTEKEFAKLMTSYAKNLGMRSTTFKNASGLPNRAQLTTARDIAKLSHALISNFPNEYKLFSNTKFSYKGKTYKTHNKLMLSYEGADGIKTGYIKASGFQLAFSAVRDDKRLIGIIFGGDTGSQRNKSLKIIMDKEFSELNIKSNNNNNNNNKEIVKKEIKETKKNNYSIVVGTFKYRNNAEKQIKLIKSKYPVSTKDKNSNIVLIKVNGKQLYESRFENFSKKEAYAACKRLKKLNCDPIMSKTGHSPIKEKMKELNSPLSGEMSGHVCYADDFYGYDDAMYVALRLLRILCNQEKSL